VEFDLVLLHPPSFYDFRTANQFRGPISDVIPSSSVFDMYPIGFTSIAGYLERHGYRVRIVNLAARMLMDRRFDVEWKIRSLHATAFGLSLHWLPHAQGALEIATLAKRLHPRTPVICGGLSATYFHRELIEHDCVDFVVRGDSTEPAMLALMDELSSDNPNFLGVPNLTWKQAGKVIVNPMGEPPETLDEIDIPDYRYAVRSVFRYRNLPDLLPYRGWLQYPLTALLTVRGCTQDCSLCGGSRSAYALHCARTRPTMRSPAKLAEDIEFIQRFSRTPIFVIGDIRQGGKQYVEEFLERMAALRPRNELVFELFWKADRDFFAQLERHVPRYSLEITLESGDEELRRLNGKFACTNAEILETVRAALDHGCRKLDLFFMVGLPRQTPASALRDIDFCEEIHLACGRDPRLFYFVAPLAPFLDPASRAFEDPARFGLRRLATTLEEHLRHLTAPSWEFMLNYETDAMTRREIVTATYASLAKMNDFKLRHGLIEREVHRRIANEIGDALAWLDHVRGAMSQGTPVTGLPSCAESRHSVARTYAELRWKVTSRYANLFSLASMGLRLLGEELVAAMGSRHAAPNGRRTPRAGSASSGQAQPAAYARRVSSGSDGLDLAHQGPRASPSPDASETAM
jgi:B12-binding domain/radical SAM domain protein